MVSLEAASARVGFRPPDRVHCLWLASFLYYTVWFFLLRCSVLSGNVGCQSLGGGRRRWQESSLSPFPFDIRTALSMSAVISARFDSMDARASVRCWSSLANVISERVLSLRLEQMTAKNVGDYRR